MKKLFLFLFTTLTSMNLVQAQCDLDFAFVNTGSNMSVFFTPDAAGAIHAELGDGTLGAFFTLDDGSLICASSSEFNGNQIQLAVMSDDATSDDVDGFSSGETIIWYYQTLDGSVYQLDDFVVTPNSSGPADVFSLNGLSFVTSSSISLIDCGDGDSTSSGDQCPSLDFDFLNTGSNMTLFITSGDLLSDLGNGSVGVYFTDDNNVEICGGSAEYSGSQVQISASADDSTSPEKDGFSSGETIIWKFEDDNGNQYNLNPTSVTLNSTGPADIFSLNGFSFVTGLSYEAISCAVDVEGCTDENYVEYNPVASIDDGSCVTIAVYGCIDSDYVEYNVNANVDDGSCLTINLQGCTDQNACNYNTNATTDDGSCYNNDLGCGCDTPAAADGYDCDGICLNDADGDEVCDEDEISGCQDESADNYNVDATDAGDCEYLGCTNDNYTEYDSSANVDDGSCTTLIVNGCTDTNAENYNPLANTADGSCEYDLIGAGCQVSFETYNSGTNHTVMIPGSVSTPLSVGDQIGVFFIGDDGSAVCAGSSIWTGENLQIVAFGDDSTTPELDGLGIGSPFLFIAQSGDDVYVVNATFQSPVMANYAVNGLSFVTGFDFEFACTVQYLGCTDLSACNYDDTANTNDGSCIYPNDVYDCEGGCVNDSDGDLVCDEFEVVGCQDASASNYDESATDPGDCVSWEEAYEACTESGGDDGIGQEDVDAAYDNGVASVDITSDNQAIADEAYGWGYGDGFSAGVASVIPEDGVTQADLDAAVAAVQADAASQIAALESQIDDILENCGDDGVTQADVDAAYANGVASVTPDDGIGQADVDAAYADGAASVDITSDNAAIADESYLFGFNAGAASVVPDDGVSQADLDVLQDLLDEALANSGGGSCEPIYIDLLEGWNIMGYTLPNPQDVAATLAPIVSNVQIVKNNSAAVYWPEYAFNGIGDFIPGQGYQIRMTNALNSFTFPDVGGQRIELSPTVPEWVHELPVLNHPNDIRTLVRVVNMLGQQVDPNTQFKGEILLYLYNDGTTEKRIVN